MLSLHTYQLRSQLCFLYHLKHLYRIYSFHLVSSEKERREKDEHLQKAQLKASESVGQMGEVITDFLPKLLRALAPIPSNDEELGKKRLADLEAAVEDSSAKIQKVGNDVTDIKELLLQLMNKPT